MIEKPTRKTRTTTTTTVQHIAKPGSCGRGNGPFLGDLRAFVAECEGLPDDVLVFIDKGHLSEGGRQDVTFRARHETPTIVPACPDAECALDDGHPAPHDDGKGSQW